MQTQITEWGSALMTSLTGALMLFFSAIPKIIGFAAIVIVGWFLASLIEKAIAGGLRAMKFNDLAKRSGFTGFIEKMSVDADAAGMLAATTKWFIRLIALVVAFDALGLPAVSDVLRQVLLWLPNAVVALVVLVIGGLAAGAFSKLVRGLAVEGGLDNSEFLAKAASVLVWSFTVIVAVNQLGIATTLINTLFMAIVGAVALALGLSFGLGGRETAAEIVKNWHGKGQARSAQIKKNMEMEKKIMQQTGEAFQDPNLRH